VAAEGVAEEGEEFLHHLHHPEEVLQFHFFLQEM
jgi:hypothetical protein